MTTTPENHSDSYTWLEQTYDDKALAWVKEQNQRTEARFMDKPFEHLEKEILHALDHEEKIPSVVKRGTYYYNFWQDAQHPKGLWRRTTWDSYKKRNPDWQTLLDIDALAAEEDTPWVFAGAILRRSDYERALILLSPDGGDAKTIREFSMETLDFVPDGFEIPAAKSGATWLDDDALLVTTDFGEGSMTTSSYPRSARILRRGATLEQAELDFEIPEDHMGLWAYVDQTPGFEHAIAVDQIDFHNATTYYRAQGAPKWTKIDVPSHVNIQIFRGNLYLRPRQDWDTDTFALPAGSLALVPLPQWFGGTGTPRIIFAPTAQTALQGWTNTRDYVIVQALTDVQSEIYTIDLHNSFARVSLPNVPQNQDVSIAAVDPDDEFIPNSYWMSVTGFLTPTTLLRGELKTVTPDGKWVSEEPKEIKRSPSFFKESDFEVSQHFATSKDGTKVPYFQIGQKNLEYDGGNPVLLSGYGGFELSNTPAYTPSVGLGWLTQRTDRADGLGVRRHGVYVVANIRGGGEYGPEWHQAALKENRHRAYEDFAAVAEDLVRRGVTQTERLGCTGGSNGGLLVGNMLTQYPQLFGAISCGVPLLDMRRYTKLSAGQSWVAEYGDPDVPEQWEYIQTFSPYHLVKGKTDYPPVLFWTATSDDRVGPEQARKMAAKMQELGDENVWFYEDLQGGHSAAADNAQIARTRALSYRFLWESLTGE